MSLDGPLEFAHPVVRSAVYQEMGALARMAAPRHAAALVLDAGGLPEQAAAHLVLTEPAGDPFVVTTLRRAGERSLAGGAPDAAAAYLRRALLEPPTLEERPKVLRDLGTAELHSDEHAAVEHLREAPEAVAAVGTPAARALPSVDGPLSVGAHRAVVAL